MFKEAIAFDRLQEQHQARYRAPLRSRLQVNAALCGHDRCRDRFRARVHGTPFETSYSWSPKEPPMPIARSRLQARRRESARAHGSLNRIPLVDILTAIVFFSL